jgi:immunity protein Imm1 of predicted polymorphic toxin system
MWSVQWKSGEQHSANTRSRVHELIAAAANGTSENPRIVEIVELESGDSIAFAVGGLASVVTMLQNGHSMSSVGTDPSDEITVYDYMGEWTEIPNRYSVPNELVLEVVKEFLLNRQRSDRIKWECDW